MSELKGSQLIYIMSCEIVPFIGFLSSSPPFVALEQKKQSKNALLRCMSVSIHKVSCDGANPLICEMGPLFCRLLEGGRGRKQQKLICIRPVLLLFRQSKCYTIKFIHERFNTYTY